MFGHGKNYGGIEKVWVIKNNMEISMNYYFTGVLVILFVAFTILVAQ
tara:strand:+ start:184 stop:324 length:141 start_codon:yes stop_codon:yes gene_type:complete